MKRDWRAISSKQLLELLLFPTTHQEFKLRGRHLLLKKKKLGDCELSSSTLRTAIS